MEFSPIRSNAGNNIEEHFNLRPILEKYLNHLSWFLVSIVVFLILAFFYLNYTSSKYEAVATVLIKDNEKGNSVSGLAAFESLGLFADAENSLENEIQILKSRKLMTQVVKELNLNQRYFLDDSPLDIEMYPETPVLISFDSKELDVYQLNTKFKLTILSKNSFKFIDHNDIESKVLKFGENFVANLGNDDVKLEEQIKIDLNENVFERIDGKTIIVKLKSINLVVDDLMMKTIVEPVNATISKVIVISLKQTVKEKAISVINNLIEQYNADGNNDKNEISQTTTRFLDERITLISAELYAIEGMAEQFKSKNRMVSNQEDADYYLQSSSLNERELVSSNTELQLINYMLEELSKRGLDQLLPGNIGLSDVGIVNLINQYNELVLQRNRVLKSSSLKNPIIVGIDAQLNVLKDNLTSSLNNLKSSTEIQLTALNVQSGKINSRIASVPKNEREFKDIVREEQTKNALYLFMLQKREESILSNAVDVNKAKIIDMAYAGNKPVSPKRGLIYLFAIFLGVLAPIIYIYLLDALDLKVQNEFDLNNLDIPYLGDIPTSSTKNNLFLNSSDNSNVAEAFRYIRTNIGFMLDSRDFGKTVFVTSTQGGEGKSFTSLNLATSLALSGKKTVLMTLDLRAPKLTKYLDLEDSLGVTNFVINKDLKVASIIEKDTRINDLHFINSGDIPPNPVELLMSKRVSEIFNYVKEHYEYVIVDTAPVGMVTDTIQINQFADMTLYVVKANFLDKRMLYIPKRMNDEGKLKNMAVLLNGTNHNKGRYGYGYGYGYGKTESKPWYKKMFSS